MEDVGLLLLLQKAATLWLCLEFTFYVYMVYCLVPSVQPVNSAEQFLWTDPVIQIQKIYDMLAKLKSYDFKNWLSGFCIGSKVEDVKAGNASSFLAWSIYSREFSDLSDDEQKVVQRLLKEAEERFGITFEEGHNATVQHVRFNLAPVPYAHHLAVQYLLLNVIEGYSNVINLYSKGFRHFRCSNGTTYWFRAGRNGKDTIPMLFMHGICTGWNPYIKLIEEVGGVDRDVILFDYRCIKINHIDVHVPDAMEVNAAVLDITRRHNITRLSIVAHSWGTFLAGWVVRMSPHLVSHITLIDPVSLMVVFPETTYTLLYKPPTVFLDYLLLYFIRHNLSISNTVYRHFSWYNGQFWLDSIPEHIGIAIGVAGNDDLVHCSALCELIDNANKVNSIMKDDDNDNSDLRKGKDEKEEQGQVGRREIKKLVWEAYTHGQAVYCDASIRDIKDAILEG